MTGIGPDEAAQALNDIERIVQRVRQSRIYDIASQIMIAAGILVLAGNVANFLAPRYANPIWITLKVLKGACAAALRTARARRVVADLFHAVLLHRRAVVRPRLHHHWSWHHRADANRVFLRR